MIINKTSDLIDHDGAVVPAPDLSWLPGFSDADLDENELGRLSASQRQKLRRDASDTLLVTALVAGVPMIPSILSGHLVAALIWGGATACCGINYAFKPLGDLTSGRVAAVEGDARTEHVSGGDDGDQYWLYVDGLKLETNKYVHRAFATGGPYRIYYLPIANAVIAAKALPGWRHRGKL